MAACVLIVDDDPDVLVQTRAHLEAAGYEVMAVDNTAEAERVIDEATPDIAVLDLMIEEVDSGFILCHKTRRKHPGLPIIMVSGVAGETGLAFDVRGGEGQAWLKADVFLNKPVRPEQLRREIERLPAAGRKPQK
ncbi:MAG: response regulator [Planctomycetota bacterium]